MDEFDVQRITLRPGDVLVVKVKGRVSMEGRMIAYKSAKEALEEAGRGDIPVIVATEEIGFAIIEKPEA